LDEELLVDAYTARKSAAMASYQQRT